VINLQRKITKIRQLKQLTTSTYGIALTMAWSAGVICTMVAAYWLMGAAVPLPTTRRPWMWECGRKKRHRQKKRDQVGIGGPLTDHSATKSNTCSKLQTSKHFRHLPAPWWGERDDLIIAPYQWQMQCPSGSMLAKATKHRLIQDTRADQGGRMMMMMRDCNIVGWSGTAAIGQ